RVRELTDRVARQWRESLRAVGRVLPAERSRRALGQARANEAEVNAILTPAQQRRLRQLGLQADGLSAFRDPEVAAALQLTAEQRERLRLIEEEIFLRWMRALWAGPPAAAPARAPK